MTPSITMRQHGAAHRPTLLKIAVTTLLAATLVVLSWSHAVPAYADSSAHGSEGQELTVTQSENLDPAGTDVTVTGTGFNENKGIYVAVCVFNGPDERPTPCVGGVDMTGESSSNGWISSNPPTYGKDLAVPFDSGGSFTLDLTVVAGDDSVDCRDKSTAPNGCVLATYADHTRLDDRSADVVIPLTFAEPGQAEPTESTEPTEPPTTQTTTESESPEPSQATPTTDAADDVTPSPTASDDGAETGTPAQFWVWIGLAAVALFGAFAVIRSKFRNDTDGDGDEVGNGDSDA